MDAHPMRNCCSLCNVPCDNQDSLQERYYWFPPIVRGETDTVPCHEYGGFWCYWENDVRKRHDNIEEREPPYWGKVCSDNSGYFSTKMCHKRYCNQRIGLSRWISDFPVENPNEDLARLEDYYDENLHSVEELERLQKNREAIRIREKIITDEKKQERKSKREAVIKAFWEYELFGREEFRRPRRIGDYTLTRRDWELLERIDRDSNSRYSTLQSILDSSRSRLSLVETINPERIRRHLSNTTSRRRLEAANREEFTPLINAALSIQENTATLQTNITLMGANFRSNRGRELFSFTGSLFPNTTLFPPPLLSPRENGGNSEEETEEESEEEYEEETEEESETASELRETLVKVKGDTFKVMDKLYELHETMEENSYIVLSNGLKKIWDLCHE